MDYEDERRFDASGVTGVAVWIPRGMLGRPQVTQAMARGVRIGEVVTQSLQNWLGAHGAPDAWVKLAIQHRAGTVAENKRECNAFLDTIARTHGIARATAWEELDSCLTVARWGVDRREVDPIDTILLVVRSSIVDMGVRFGEEDLQP